MQRIDVTIAAIQAEIGQKLKWIKLYHRSKDAGFVCRRCGISRPTLRKWLNRYTSSGHRDRGPQVPNQTPSHITK